jgi:plastocyanin
LEVIAVHSWLCSASLISKTKKTKKEGLKMPSTTKMKVQRRPILLVLVALLLAASQALAVHTSPLEIDDTTNGANATDPNGAATAPDDWETVIGTSCASPNGASPFPLQRLCIPDPGGTADDIFTTGGSKDTLDIPSWRWTTGNVPGKDQIEHAGIALYQSGSDQFLYLFLDREANNGTAQAGFWILQNQITKNPDGTFSGVHVNGDILIQSNFIQGGDITQLTVWLWCNPSSPGTPPASPCSNPSDNLHLVASVAPSTGFICTLSDAVCAAVNKISTTLPWVSPSSVAAGKFIEVGIKLTDPQIGFANKCGATFVAETRASAPLDSVLKDFAMRSFNTCGTVVINKSAVGGDDTFSYTASGSGIPPSFSITTTGGSGSQTFSNLASGSYTVTEQGPPAGWAFTGLACIDPDGGTTVSGQTATIDLDPGETVTCTFTNTRQGTVVINKSAVGGDDTFSYTASGSGIPPSFSITTTGGSGSQTFSNLASGSYTVTEQGPPAGWAFTGLACIDPDGGTTVSGQTATIDLDPGETVTCTFTNTRQGAITIIKDTVPDDPQDFSFTTTGGLTPATFSLDDDGDATLPNTQTYTNVAPGTYTITEGDPTPAFDLTGIQCTVSGAGTSATPNVAQRRVDITLGPGGQVTCTFTNTKRPPVGGDPPIYKNIVVFPTPELAWGGGPNRDFNGNRTSTDCILRYMNLETGKIVNTGLTVSCEPRQIDIYEEVIVFVGEGNHIRYYDIRTGAVADIGVPGSHPTIYGSMVAFAAEGTIHYFDLKTRHLTNTHIPGEVPVLYDGLIAFADGSPATIRYYDLHTGLVTDTQAIGNRPVIYGKIIAFTSEERAVGADLNDDGDLNDWVIRYYDVERQSIHNTGAVGTFPAIHGNRIAFETQERLIGQDLNGDGDTNDWVIRYYDLELGQVFNTGRVGVEPDIYEDVISFWVFEPWERLDINGDGDRLDPVVQTYRIIARDASAGTPEAPEVVPLVVTSIRAMAGRSSVRFVAEGQGIQEIKVQIFDLIGREIYRGEFTAGREVAWQMVNNAGSRVANGVYLYIVIIKGEGGIKRSAVKKLVVLR